MKYKLFARMLSLLLAVTFVGCTPSPDSTGGGQDEGGVRRVVEHGESDFAGYAAEHPAIDDDITFSSEVEVRQTTGRVDRPEVKAVWISYLEMMDLLTGKTQQQFTANIAQVFDNTKDLGLNTVVVHVRPFGDALYDSGYFPWSYLITGTEGQDPGFDPLAIMVQEAKSRNLRIEAWINPYRVRAAGNENALSSGNQAKQWLDAGESHVITYNGVTSYNPASEKAQDLIVNGVREIVRNYQVDGIHIDDYFYPTTDSAFDAGSYASYQNGGGGLSLAEWRRGNVETLIKKMYGAVKEENSSVVFGISPQSSVSNNYNDQYLDVKKITAAKGYCDYIAPQIYFGYENAIQPYLATLQSWDEMVTEDSIDLYVGLAVYKVGTTDAWAGIASNEWAQNTDLLARMVQDARNCSSYNGVILYRYESLFQPSSTARQAVEAEKENLQKIL